jgi:hypothetical protein
MIYNFQIRAFMMRNVESIGTETSQKNIFCEFFAPKIILNLNHLILQDGDSRLKYGW